MKTRLALLVTAVAVANACSDVSNPTRPAPRRHWHIPGLVECRESVPPGGRLTHRMRSLRQDPGQTQHRCHRQKAPQIWLLFHQIGLLRPKGGAAPIAEG